MISGSDESYINVLFFVMGKSTRKSPQTQFFTRKESWRMELNWCRQTNALLQGPNWLTPLSTHRGKLCPFISRLCSHDPHGPGKFAGNITKCHIYIFICLSLLNVSGAEVQCLLQADRARVTEWVLPRAACWHLLLPGGRQHCCDWAACGEQRNAPGSVLALRMMSLCFVSCVKKSVVQQCLTCCHTSPTNSSVLALKSNQWYYCSTFLLLHR